MRNSTPLPARGWNLHRRCCADHQRHRDCKPIPWRSTAATTKPSSMSRRSGTSRLLGRRLHGVGLAHHVEDFQNNLETLHQYTPEGLQMIFRGEIGRYENCRYVEQTNIPKGGAANSTTSTPTPTRRMLGTTPSPIGFSSSARTPWRKPSRFPRKSRRRFRPTTAGRGVAWYYLGGFGLVNTAAANARVVSGIPPPNQPQPIQQGAPAPVLLEN